MNDLGIMVYGYSREKAESIKAAFVEILGVPVALFTATAREHATVKTIIESGAEGEGVFADRADPVVMFLGFSDIEISDAMDAFPAVVGPGPIFCTLTDENYYWTFSELHEHLIEERRRITGT
jgi:hypothetical protein